MLTKKDSTHRLISLKEYQEYAPINTFCLVGSVAAGKTEATRFLTNKDTKKFGKEQLNGCTIKMGHANLKIYYNGSDYILNPTIRPNGFKLIRHFSIADNPGHNSFMTTMITGSSTIDSALFLVSGDKGIEPQSHQHMKCLKSTGITDFAMVISKVDLISTQEALRDVVSSIDNFMDEQQLGEEYDPPIIPMSSFTKTNTDYLIKYLVSNPYPKKIMTLTEKPFNMTIIRSFDVNKPGNSVFDIKGAVFGGSIQEGYLTIGDVICILPGNVQVIDGSYVYTPLITQVVGLKSDTTDLEVGLPGGFIGVSTTLDPSYGKNNRMVGNIMVKISSKQDIDKLCNVTNIIYVSNVVNLIEEDLIEDNDYLLVIHGSEQMAKLVSIVDGLYKFVLNCLVATIIDERVAILTKKNCMIDMVSYGKINSVKKCDNIMMDLQVDFEHFMTHLPIDKKINTIELVNDIEDFEESEAYKEELIDIDSLIQNIEFDKKKYVVKCDNILLDTTTTSVIIMNANNIMSNFTNDAKISMTLCAEFAKYITTSIDTLKQATINVDNVKISFDGLRNTRKYLGPQFNTLLDSFISVKFKCPTCSEIGPLYYEPKKTFCRACKAVSMSKH